MRTVKLFGPRRSTRRVARLRAGVVVSLVGTVAVGSTLVDMAPSSATTNSGIISTVVGGGANGALTDGIPSTSAILGSPVGAVFDSHGNIVFADPNNDVIRVAATTSGSWYRQSMVAGHLYTIAGNGVDGDGPFPASPTDASLSDPNGVAVDSQGDVAITDTTYGAVRYLAEVSGTRFGVSMTAGTIYTIAGEGGSPAAVDQDSSAGLIAPDGIAFDPYGNLVIADTANDDVRLLPAQTGTYFGQFMQAGFIYIIAGNLVYGYTGNGGPATSAELGMDTYDGVATDSRGDVIFADDDNNVVRLVAASTGSYLGRPVTQGDIYTIAGNGNPGYKGDKKAATAAQLDVPQGVAVDGAGDVFISDSINNVIRLVPANNGTYGGATVKAGHIYTIVGNSQTGYSGDGGAATSAELNSPADVSVSSSGNLLAADNGNNVLRVVEAGSSALPAVAKVKPATGPTTGDRRVTIKGTNLAGTTAVYFGSRPAVNFIVKSAKKIVATSPTSSVGRVTVTVVTTTGENSASLTDAYTYLLDTPTHHHKG